jgi:hypothetical protein
MGSLYPGARGGSPANSVPAYTGRKRAAGRIGKLLGARQVVPRYVVALARSWEMPYRKFNLTVRELPPLLDDWREAAL